MANMIYGSGDLEERPDNLIRLYFSDELLRALMIICLRVDISDNNDKAELIKMIMPEGFDELGTGTNRIAFLHAGTVFKIALDRRGLVDNFTEFKRSQELPMYLARTYETNLLINVCEYVTIIDQPFFRCNEDQIKQVLRDIAKGYLFDDIGFSYKNYCNWGSRFVPDGTPEGGEDLVILDYGYLYPLRGQDIKSLFKCPKCGGQLKWNSSYTGLVCSNIGKCNVQVSPTYIRHNMTLDFESDENNVVMQINSMDMPDLDSVEKALTYSDEED